MNSDRLFLCTISDIQKRSVSSDPYEIMMIAALLRKVLMDSSPLVHLVNKTRNVEVKFAINEVDAPSSRPAIWLVQDGFDPETCPPHLVVNKLVSLPVLLKQPVILVGDVCISVKDLIRYLSHVMGAVHAGTPGNNKERILVKIDEEFGVGGLPATIRSLLAITRVVVKGLEPLVGAILASGTT